MNNYHLDHNGGLARALGPALHERLSNWGRVMRLRPTQAVNPVHVICARLAEIAGVPREPQLGGFDVALRADAELCEKAWSFMRHDLRWKAALADYYVVGLPLPIVARRARAPLARAADEIVAAGKHLELIRLRIQRGVPMDDNRASHIANTG